MSRNNLAVVVALAFLFHFSVQPAFARDLRTQYPAMAPLEQYLMADRNNEVALARSAAPASISRDATVLVLGKNGYESAVEGKNGFTCMVERSWMSPIDSPEFWNPKMRGPICYNPAAERTVLPYTLTRTKLALTGLTKAQIRQHVIDSVSENKLPRVEAGAMSYMMSKGGYLGDSVGHWCPHLMFYAPKTAGASWGADLAGSPVLFNDNYQDVPEPETIFMVAVPHWSDGSAEPH